MLLMIAAAIILSQSNRVHNDFNRYSLPAISLISILKSWKHLHLFLPASARAVQSSAVVFSSSSSAAAAAASASSPSFTLCWSTVSSYAPSVCFPSYCQALFSSFLTDSRSFSFGFLLYSLRPFTLTASVPSHPHCFLFFLEILKHIHLLLTRKRCYRQPAKQKLHSICPPSLWIFFLPFFHSFLRLRLKVFCMFPVHLPCWKESSSTKDRFLHVLNIIITKSSLHTHTYTIPVTHIHHNQHQSYLLNHHHHHHYHHHHHHNQTSSQSPPFLLSTSIWECVSIYSTASLFNVAAVRLDLPAIALLAERLFRRLFGCICQLEVIKFMRTILFCFFRSTLTSNFSSSSHLEQTFTVNAILKLPNIEFPVNLQWPKLSSKNLFSYLNVILIVFINFFDFSPHFSIDYSLHSQLHRCRFYG